MPVADTQRQKASKLTAAYQQLQAYVRGLKTAYNAECSKTREPEKAYHDTLRSRRPHKAAFDHAQTCGIILYGDGRTRSEHFDPRLLEILHMLHQAFEAIYCEPHGGTTYGDCSGDQEWEGYSGESRYKRAPENPHRC